MSRQMKLVSASPGLDLGPSFSPVLPSAIVPLGEGGAGYPGDLGRLGVIFDLARVMDLSDPGIYREVIGEGSDQVEAAIQHMETLLTEFRAMWEPLEAQITANAEALAAGEQAERVVITDAESEAYTAAALELNQALADGNTLMRQSTDARNLRLLAWTLADIGVISLHKETDWRGRLKEIEVLTWPFKDVRPTPEQPDTLHLLPWYAREWLVTVGFDQVRGSLQSPLFGARSIPSTTK